MKLPPVSKFAGITLLLLVLVSAARGQSWAGEYTDKKFLNGGAVFQLTIEQQGQDIQVSFDAAYNDGRGCSPEAQGMANPNRGRLQFTFQDSSGNIGIGTITREGSDLLLSLKPTRVVVKDCIVFYRDNIRLKRVGK